MEYITALVKKIRTEIQNNLRCRNGLFEELFRKLLRVVIEEITTISQFEAQREIIKSLKLIEKPIILKEELMINGTYQYESLDIDDWLRENPYPYSSYRTYNILGKITQDVYQENKLEIDKLRDEDDIEGLKNYF